MTNSELASKMQGVARCLTYNDDEHQAAAKRLLIEAAHRLDSGEIRAHKKDDGLLFVNARGKARYATWRERLAYHIAGSFPSEL